MKKRIFLMITTIFTFMTLTGCNPYQTGEGGERIINPIDPASGIWDKIFVNPISQLLEFTAGLFDNSFAMGILLTTIIVRTVLYPIYTKSNDASAKMQEIQPEMKKLQEKYANKKDPDSQRAMQVEMMALYKEHGVNPLAGCLLPFLQMPVFMAMYHAVVRTPKTLELEGKALDTKLFWMDLSKAPQEDLWVYIIIPLLVAGTMVLLQKMSTLNLSPEAKNNQMMKMMIWIMPAMMASFAYMQPAALGFYWFVGNVYSTMQTIIVKKPFKKLRNQG